MMLNGPAPEVFQNKLKADLEAREAEAAAKLPQPKPIAPPKAVAADKPAVEPSKAVPADMENPAYAKYEALPDKDLTQIAINRGLKFDKANFNRTEIIKLLAGA